MDNEPSFIPNDGAGDEYESPAEGQTAPPPPGGGMAERAIHLDLETELSGVDLSKKVSIIVEGIPDGCTLSVGKNNGNKTWSVRQTELRDVRAGSSAGSHRGLDAVGARSQR